MNLHLFPADDQLFVPKFVEVITHSDQKQSNLVMCYVREMDILPFASPELVKESITQGNVNRIIFHSLQPEAYSLIKLIIAFAPECRIDWVYWGENYENISSTFDKQSLIEFMTARGLPRLITSSLVVKKLAHALFHTKTLQVRHKAAIHARHIDTMFHWSHQDYVKVKQLLKCEQLRYKNFFYECIDPSTINSELLERELDCDPKDCIVLGHSATIRNNHLDILPAVCEFAVKRNKMVICPLSYNSANKDYVSRIEKYMSEVPGLLYRICYKFYPLSDYSSFLSKCGAYIAPGYGSIGAGNMFYYVISGGVPVTSRLNSTGMFLESLGADIAKYDSNNDIFGLLDKAFGMRCQKNRIIVGKYFSIKNNSKYIEELLAVVKQKCM